MQLESFVESNDILNDPQTLRRRFRMEGYLLIRGLLPKDLVLDLRQRILGICDEAGWIREGTDFMEGLTDHEPIMIGEPAMLPVYEKVQKLEPFHRLKLHPNIQRVMEDLFDEPVFCIPQTIGRTVFPRDPERATQPHQDWLYVQGSTETVTGWVPLGDIPDEVGGLMLQPESHKAGFLFPQQAPGPGGHAVRVDSTLPFLSASFRAGDVLLFHSLIVHAGRPNTTPDRLRLSLDFRYVGQSHTVMEDWLLPHFNWLGHPFTWDNLDSDWTDQSLRRYWEQMPKMRTIPHERRVYVKE